MKNKAIIGLPLWLLFPTFLLAQTPEFDLSTYTPPNYVYRSLDFSYYLAGSTSGNITHDDDVLTGKNTVNYFSTSISPEYYRYSNNSRYQGSMNTWLYAGTSINNVYNLYSEGNEINHRQSGNAFKLFYTGEHRFYFSGKKFIEIDPKFQLLTQNIKYTDKIYTNDSLTFNSTTKMWVPNALIQLPVFAGLGRIDDVTDARHALYILNGLNERGKLSRSYSEQDVYTLASEITKLKNKRFFDSRHRIIADLVALDSILQTAGLCGQPDAVSFATLNDEWMNSRANWRYSGFRVYAGFDPSYEIHHTLTHVVSKLETSDESKSYINNSLIYMGLKAGFKHEKPLSLRWQSSLDASIGYGIAQEITSDKSLIPDDSELRKSTKSQQQGYFRSYYSAGFYPNSRTWLNAGFDSYVRYHGKGTYKQYAVAETDTPHNFSFSAGPDVSAYYYLSSQLRLQFNCGLSYQYHWQDIQYDIIDRRVNNIWDFTLNSALTYSFF